MKKFVMGLILGAGLMLGVSAHAEVTSLVGSVIEGQFPVKIDGVDVGAPGIVVNGTSYLPVRTMGELLGYDVSFNADLGVELKKKSVLETKAQRTPSKTRELINQKRQERIDAIEKSIELKEEAIRALEAQLQNIDISETEKENIESIIEMRKNEIEALETEKAELEKQLNEAP